MSASGRCGRLGHELDKPLVWYSISGRGWELRFYAPLRWNGIPPPLPHCGTLGMLPQEMARGGTNPHDLLFFNKATPKQSSGSSGNSVSPQEKTTIVCSVASLSCLKMEEKGKTCQVIASLMEKLSLRRPRAAKLACCSHWLWWLGRGSWCHWQRVQVSAHRGHNRSSAYLCTHSQVSEGHYHCRCFLLSSFFSEKPPSVSVFFPSLRNTGFFCVLRSTLLKLQQQ